MSTPVPGGQPELSGQVMFYRKPEPLSRSTGLSRKFRGKDKSPRMRIRHGQNQPLKKSRAFFRSC